MENNHYLFIDHSEKVFFSLPSGWINLSPVQAENEKYSVSVSDLAKNSIEKPVSAYFFQNAKLDEKRIAIIVDDNTRPTPVGDILPVLIEKLKRQNASEDNIKIIVAVGSHATMPEEALKARLGANVAGKYKVIQHNALQTDLVPLDVPEAGMTVKVNPEVINADIKIGISSILPHNFAGFGGGPKILMPGVCDRESMIKHHMLNAIHKNAKSGITKGNPFHELCMKIAGAIGLDLSIDCVYDKHGNLIDIVGGSLENAYSGAVEICIKRLGYRLNEKADITISSSYPHTHGIQFCKGLSTPIAITKVTGAIILLAPVKVPLPDDFVNAVSYIRDKYQNDTPAYLKGIMSQGRLVLEDKSPEFNMALFDLLGRPAIRKLLVAPMIPPDSAAKLGFEYAYTVEEAVQRLQGSFSKAKVAVLPAGGLIIPMLRA